MSESTVKGKVRPFSNGSEYDTWSSLCCEKCKKACSPNTNYEFLCGIEEALTEASFSDGLVSEDIARRMGLTWEEHWNPFKRLCTEIELVE